MKICFVDYRTPENDIYKLQKEGLDVIKIPKCPALYEAINGHPDIQLHIINNSEIILSKNSSQTLINSLEGRNLTISKSERELTEKYPYDIILNGISTNNFFIHNIKYTDPKLLTKMSSRKLINVTQGYTKCSCAVVSENAIITSDKKIEKILKENGFNVLLIPPGDILLPGLDYGFIGGCCGLISKEKMAFFGNLDNYIYGNEVKNFLKTNGVSPLYLNNGKLVDRGSILTIF